MPLLWLGLAGLCKGSDLQLLMLIHGSLVKLRCSWDESRQIIEADHRTVTRSIQNKTNPLSAEMVHVLSCAALDQRLLIAYSIKRTTCMMLQRAIYQSDASYKPQSHQPGFGFICVQSSRSTAMRPSYDLSCTGANS